MRKDCEVYEENWEIVMIFLKMSTQWNVGMAGPTGLRYESLQWLIKLYGVDDPVACFEGIQVMEAKALTCLSKKS